MINEKTKGTKYFSQTFSCSKYICAQFVDHSGNRFYCDSAIKLCRLNFVLHFCVVVFILKLKYIIWIFYFIEDYIQSLNFSLGKFPVIMWIMPRTAICLDMIFDIMISFRINCILRSLSDQLIILLGDFQRYKNENRSDVLLFNFVWKGFVDSNTLENWNFLIWLSFCLHMLSYLAI